MEPLKAYTYKQRWVTNRTGYLGGGPYGNRVVPCVQDTLTEALNCRVADVTGVPCLYCTHRQSTYAPCAIGSSWPSVPWKPGFIWL